MKVFKFGGASINKYDRINDLSYLLENYKGEKILIVISAMGKTTNALEKVVEEFYSGKKDEAFRLFQKIKDSHLNLLKYLVTLQWEKATNDLTNILNHADSLLQETPLKDYNYYYDQIVCIGELLSTTLISYFLNEKKIPNLWIDVRNILRTDNTFRDAKVDWDYSRQAAKEKLFPLFEKNDFIIIQGFIGGTKENDSTTLGREGSDYTAAIFAELSGAESVTIWKDVNGVMNADPKEFKSAETIGELSYKEVIEMAYYGAQVIHPKTIKPLQNNKIPLYVRPFTDMRLSGTVISEKQNFHLPPIIVYKHHQALITLQSIDFSFVEGKPLQFLLSILEKRRSKPNLTQNGAISMMVCVDDIPEKIEQIASEASKVFDVQIRKGLTLLTIRHYTKEFEEQFLKGKDTLLEQKTPDTLQILIPDTQLTT